MCGVCYWALPPFSDYEKSTYRLVARRNVVEAAQNLINGCERLNLAFQSPDSAAAAKHVLSVDPSHADFWAEELIAPIKHLWYLAAHRTLSLRCKLGSSPPFCSHLQAEGAGHQKDVCEARSDSAD